MERILIGAEKSYGEKTMLSAVVIFPLPIYDNTQHAPNGSTIGRVLRFAFCCGVGCSVSACSLFASGEGEEATDGIEVARSAGHTEVALQSIVGETGVLIALGGVYVGTALGEM